MDVAIRDAMVSAAAGDRDFFEVLREIGAAAVEIEVGFDYFRPQLRQGGGAEHSLVYDAHVGSLRRWLDDQGVRPSALLVNTDFSGPQADAHVRWAVRVVEIARQLGAPVVRIDPLTRDKAVSADEARDNFIRRVARVLEETAGSGVDLGVENHGPFANDPAFLDAVFDAVPDPRLGMTLDTGNFYWFGYPLSELYRLLERYAPRAKHTHVKNINYPADLAESRRPVGLEYARYCCALDEGNIDLRRVVRILRSAGYDRDLCVENESLGKVPPDQKVDVLRRDVRAARRAIENSL